jgi:hypothetical protein
MDFRTLQPFAFKTCSMEPSHPDFWDSDNPTE